MKRVIVTLLCLLVLLPTPALAHVGNGDGEEIYNISVEINKLSIVDDLNWFILGDADVLFDYEVDPTNPEHKTISGVTTEPIEIGDNETKSFPPIPIYQHQICGCDQELDVTISAMDYSPIQTMAIGAFFGGLDLGESFLVSGPVGLYISAAGKLLSFVVDYFQTLGLSESEAKAYAEAKLRENSEYLGTAQDTHTTTCENLSETFTTDLLLEEYGNGSVTYTVAKTPTGELCNPPVDTGVGMSPDPTTTPTLEPGVTSPADPTVTPPDPTPIDEPTATPEEEKPECLPESGKVLVNGEYYCPSSAVPSGDGCVCIPDYEWAFPNDLCQGCTKTKKEDCLEATRASIDWATGTPEPALSYVGDDQIKWDAGEGSCKHIDEVITDFSNLINEAIPMYNERCTNLRLEGGYQSASGQCAIEFMFNYKAAN